jgi:hypothetical protein
MTRIHRCLQQPTLVPQGGNPPEPATLRSYTGPQNPRWADHMRKSLSIVGVLALASCDVSRGVVRRVSPGPGFDRTRAQALLVAHQFSGPTDVLVGGHEPMDLTIRQGRAYVAVSHSKGKLLELSSLYLLTNEDLAPVIKQTNLLHSEIIDVLHLRCLTIPPESDWDTKWSWMAAQHDDATDRATPDR